MKRPLSLLIAVALALPIVPAAAQDHRDPRPGNEAGPGERSRQDDRGRQDDRARDNDHRGQSAHRFKKGEKFSRARASNYARLNYRENRRLSAPSRGYVWVRSGRDALLVRLSNNLISRVILNAF